MNGLILCKKQVYTAVTSPYNPANAFVCAMKCLRSKVPKTLQSRISQDINEPRKFNNRMKAYEIEALRRSNIKPMNLDAL